MESWDWGAVDNKSQDATGVLVTVSVAKAVLVGLKTEAAKSPLRDLLSWMGVVNAPAP